MKKRACGFVITSAYLSLCLVALQSSASVFDDMRNSQNAVRGKIVRTQVNTSSIDIDLLTDSGVKKRYQLCRSDLRGRGASVLMVQTALQSKDTVELLTSDAFNSCVDSIAVVKGDNK